MPSKRILSWSKRSSSSEPYYRTGGLLPIDTVATEPSNELDAKTALKTERPSLVILPPDKQQYDLSPVTDEYNGVLVSATTSLQTAFNDLLRSPVSSISAFSRSASVQKPLPNRPRSVSVSSIAELPAELPGSLLLENQGFPSCTTSIPTRPVTQIYRRESHPPSKCLDYERVSLDALNLISAPLAHTRSVPELSSRYSTMRHIRSSNALNPGTATKAEPLEMKEKHLMNNAGVPSRSRSHLGTPPFSPSDVGSVAREERNRGGTVRAGTGRVHARPALSVEEKIYCGRDSERPRGYRSEASSPLNPSRSRLKQIEEPKSTTTPDLTISKLKTQFSRLRASHEAKVASLVETHQTEVASLRNQIRVLEEQNGRHELHHASIDSFPFVLDTTGSTQIPTRACSQNKPSHAAAKSLPSIRGPFEGRQTPQNPQENSEMVFLRRKLSIPQPSETETRNLAPELNQFKQNNVALQGQIMSLMAKLTESKKNERELRSTLGMTEMRCAEWEDKAAHADNLAMKIQALENTIEDLESRLEIANTNRIDAEEQLSNFQGQKSPFDVTSSKLEPVISDADVDSKENSVVAAIVARVERLQEEVREKNACIAELEEDREQLRQQCDQLRQENNKLSIHSDIQEDLLHKTTRTGTDVETLQEAINERDAIIAEKQKTIRVIARQLEYHKLLLQAEIRKHAAIKLYTSSKDDPLPDLTTLAKREDIDRWMRRLKERLARDRPRGEQDPLLDTPDAQLKSLQHEVDFYVREIILFKLDIKGYRSDIRKLRKMTEQMNGCERACDHDSDVSSLRPVASTPVRSAFCTSSPEVSGFNSSPPVVDTPSTATAKAECPTSPSLSSPSHDSCHATTPTNRLTRVMTRPLELDIPTTLQELMEDDLGSGTTRVDSNLSPCSALPLSPDYRNDFVMSFPNLDVPRPLVHKRSISESSLARHPVSALSYSPTPFRMNNTLANGRTHCRSSSTSDTTKEMQQYGAFDKFKPYGIRNISVPSLPDVPESPVASPVPATPTTLRLRMDSAASEADRLPLEASPHDERRPSVTRISKVPAATSFSTVLPKSCSITSKAPLKIAPPTSRRGLGGTMASSTPVTSPTSQTAAFRQDAPYTPISTNSLQAIFAPYHRKNSLRTEVQEVVSTPPQTPAHLRNVSGTSVRTTNRVPDVGETEKEVEVEVEVEMLRKDSITIPQPLFSPFDFEQSLSRGLEERFGGGGGVVVSPKESF